MAKQRKGNGWVSWFIIGLIGVLLIAGQQLIKNILYIVLAAGLILAAVVNIIDWWKYKEKSIEAISRLLGDAAMICIGIWIFCHPTAFDTLINVLIGLVLMIYGAVWMVRGFQMGRDMVVIIMAAIAILFGIIIASTNGATGWPIVVEGLGLIYTAVTGLVSERRR